MLEENLLTIEKFTSSETGINILLIGAIHGDETCGAYALHRLGHEIKSGKISLKKGSVTTIPIANPIAHARKARKINLNLNRIIGLKNHVGDYPEYDYASQIESAIQDAHIIVDLHSTPHGGNPFVFQDYPTQSGMALAKSVGCDAVVQDWPMMLHNSGVTDLADTPLYCHKQGKNSILIECGKNGTDLADQIAYQAVIKTLVFFEMIDTSVTQESKVEAVAIYQAYYVMRKDKEGSFAKHYQDLDPLEKGEIIINYDDGQSLMCPDDDLYLMIPTPNATIGEEWFYFVKKIT